MIVRYKASAIKGNTFDIASESEFRKYTESQTTEYDSSDKSIATVSNQGVITAVGVGRAVISVIDTETNDGVEINFETIGIDIDYDASGIVKSGNDNILNFENQREIKLKITPGYIIRTKLSNATTPGAAVEGIEIEQPTDTTVIVKATKETISTANINLELVDRHSKYVGIIYDLKPGTTIVDEETEEETIVGSEQYTNLNGETVDKTYDKIAVKKGIKVWDKTNKCYRYADSFNSETLDEGKVDQETGKLGPTNPNDPNNFYDYITKDATFFYESVYESETIKAQGLRLPDNVEVDLKDAGTIEDDQLVESVFLTTDLDTAGSTGQVNIVSDNVTTDSVRISSWPMDLEFRPNQAKTGFVFDLNSAIPYNYKVKVEYNGKVTDFSCIKVLGDKLTISKKPIIINEATRAKAYAVELGECSAVEFYSNPVRDKAFITYDVSDRTAIELFYVGTVQLARFNKVGNYAITATYATGKPDEEEEEFTINVTVMKSEYTVTFETGDEEVIVDPKTARYNHLVEKPIDPVREGYDFKGWFKESTFVHEWNFDKDVILEDTTLYAKWQVTPTPTPDPENQD